MQRPDYYEFLGVSRNASKSEIAAAYRKLARKYHPDHNPNDCDAIEKMKICNDAYEHLVDPEKRRLYDAGLEVSDREQQWAKEQQRQKKEEKQKEEEKRRRKESNNVWTPAEWIRAEVEEQKRQKEEEIRRWKKAEEEMRRWTEEDDVEEEEEEVPWYVLKGDRKEIKTQLLWMLVVMVAVMIASAISQWLGFGLWFW